MTLPRPRAAMHRPAYASHRRARQHGLSLVELLIGLAVGLLTSMVAIGTLPISRQTTGAINDAAQLQQQAAYVLRIIGQQARQAGSLRLNLAFGKASHQPIDIADPVAFDAPAGMDALVDAVHGETGNAGHGDRLAFAQQNYTEHLAGHRAPQSQLRDCLGQQPSQAVLRSSFMLDAQRQELHCAGSDNRRQAMATNVTDFQVRFLEQARTTAGSPTMQYRTAAEVVAWPQVHAVEICLEMAGTERLPDTGATFLNCNHQRTAHGSRWHLVVRNSYQIRSQGLPRREGAS